MIFVKLFSLVKFFSLRILEILYLDFLSVVMRTFFFIVVDFVRLVTTQVFPLEVIFYCLLHELCDACGLSLYSSCSVEYNVGQLSETDISYFLVGCES